MIVQQVADVNPKKALVAADDTDVFVLLLHFCCKEDIPASTSVLMVSPILGRSMIDINATVNQHHDIIPNLLAAHGLTGSNTVAPYFGIGKSVALNVLRSGVHSLSSIGDTNCTLSDIMSQATPYILACYGQTRCMTMTEARQKMWAKKVSRSIASAPKLSSLPPTTVICSECCTCSPASGSMEERIGTKSSTNRTKRFWMVTSSWQGDVSNTYFRWRCTCTRCSA